MDTDRFELAVGLDGWSVTIYEDEVIGRAGPVVWRDGELLEVQAACRECRSVAAAQECFRDAWLDASQR